MTTGDVTSNQKAAKLFRAWSELKLNERDDLLATVNRMLERSA